MFWKSFINVFKNYFNKKSSNLPYKKIVEEKTQVNNKEILRKYEVTMVGTEEIDRRLIEQIDTVKKEKKGVLTKILVIKKNDERLNKLVTTFYKKSKIKSENGKVNQEDYTLKFLNGKKITEKYSKIYKDMKKHFTSKKTRVMEKADTVESEVEYKNGKLVNKKEVKNGIIDTAVGKYEYKIYKVKNEELKLSDCNSFTEFMAKEYPDVNYNELSEAEKDEFKKKVIKFTVKLDKCTDEHGKKYLLTTGKNEDEVKENVRAYYDEVNRILEEKKIDVDNKSVVLWNNKGVQDGEETGDDGYYIGLLEDLIKERIFENIEFAESKESSEKDKFIAELLDISGLENLVSENYLQI